MVVSVEILRGDKINNSGVNYKTPEQLIIFVNKFPNIAKAMEKKKVIKIKTKKDNGTSK